MQRSLVHEPPSPCIWMSAGLVRYRLCDRDFDCERCPLDAALRGDAGWAAADQPHAAEAGHALRFPDDRRYSRGHCWMEPRGGSVRRVGVDALAAALMGSPAGVRARQGAGAVAAGDPVVVLDLLQGALPVGAPAAGCVLRLNERLERSPRLVVEDPYGDGWLFDIEGDGDGALDAAEALRQARMDLRHFGRRAALALLSQADELGATMADGGEPLTDLRGILGPHSYLALLRDLVH